MKTKKHPLYAVIFAVLVITGTATTGVAARDVPASDFLVTCTSSIAWDIGPCTAQAFGRCNGRGAKLLGALASTYLAANNLHQITARYMCR